MHKIITRLLLVLTLLVAAQPAAILLSAGPLIAQARDNVPDYVEWEMVATRAEGVLVDRRASNVALGTLRADIVDWRTQFLNVQATNQSRIQTVKSQISALGPLPTDGTEEVSEIAVRRAELNSQLAQLEAPKIQSDEAYSRADGIIREIDAIVRERQAARLTELGDSPLDPTAWPVAFRALSQTITSVKVEISSAWQSSAQSEDLKKNAPSTLLYLVLALALLIRGRPLMERLTLYVQSGGSSARIGVLGLLVSLGQIILPYAGIWALSEAISSSKLLGLRGQIILDGLPLLGLAIFGASWLALRLFPKSTHRNPAINVTADQGRNLRLYGALLGALYGLHVLVKSVSEFEFYTAATETVLFFPLLVLTGILLFQAGRIILKSAPTAIENSEINAPNIRDRVTRFVGQFMVAVGVVGPVLAAAGFSSAANYMVFPTVLTIALIGLLTVLQGFLGDLLAMISKRDPESYKDALLPVLFGFGLVLCSIPVFALIWGAQVSDLTEIWARFREGFAIGETRISPSDFLTFAVVFAIGYSLTRLVQGAMRTTILPKTNIDPGGQTALVSGLGYIGIFLAAIIAITTAGIDLSSLAIVAGALSVGIGFGLQNIVSNFVSGIILLIERPISEGDWIEVGGQMGYVRDISVRSTRIETFDRTDVIVPNADLVSGTVTNYTRGNLIGRVIVDVGVAYGTDTKKVTEILTEIAEAQPLVTINPPPSVIFVGFGADSLDFQIRAILRDVNFVLSVKSDINHEIARRFTEEGIEIPFAQRDVWLRNPEVLQPAAKPARKSGGTSK